MMKIGQIGTQMMKILGCFLVAFGPGLEGEGGGRSISEEEPELNYNYIVIYLRRQR